MKAMFCAAATALALGGCAATPEPQTAAVAPDLSAQVSSGRAGLDAKINFYARIYNIPASLIHRSIRRESNYNPAARNGPYWGLMQIRYDTAQGMGYRGPASGLLDADTNLRFAGAYLANAYKVGGGSETRAIQLYAGGYYYEAKRKGMLSQLIVAER